MSLALAGCAVPVKPVTVKPVTSGAAPNSISSDQTIIVGKIILSRDGHILVPYDEQNLPRVAFSKAAPNPIAIENDGFFYFILPHGEFDLVAIDCGLKKFHHSPDRVSPAVRIQTVVGNRAVYVGTLKIDYHRINWLGYGGKVDSLEIIDEFETSKSNLLGPGFQPDAR